MATPKSEADSPPRSDERVDLGRLRIDRGKDDGRVRGFPWIRLLVVVLVLCALWLFREPIFGLVNDARGTEVEVARAVKVRPGGEDEGRVAANGYVVANRSASLASVLSGRLVELHVGEGDRVEANEVVARIQYDDLEAEHGRAKAMLASVEKRVTQARAQLDAAKLDVPRLEADIDSLGDVVDQAKAQAEQAEREVERNQQLFERDRIDASTWDRVQTEARVARLAVVVAAARKRRGEAALAQWIGHIDSLDAAWKVAQSEVDAATHAVELARIQVDKTYIRAPFAGLVIRKDAEEGEVIAPTGAGNSRGSVVTIVEPASLEVQVELTEKRILRVGEGDTATVRLDADPDTGYPARVRKIWPRAERSTGTIEVRVVFDEIPAVVRPEMAVRVVFDGEPTPADAVPQKAYVRAPTRAVRGVGDERYVFVLVEDAVRKTDVTLGDTLGRDVVIESGLEGGERLVLDPPPSLRDGHRVRPKGGK